MDDPNYYRITAYPYDSLARRRSRRGRPNDKASSDSCSPEIIDRTLSSLSDLSARTGLQRSSGTEKVIGSSSSNVPILRSQPQFTLSPTSDQDSRVFFGLRPRERTPYSSHCVTGNPYQDDGKSYQDNSRPYYDGAKDIDDYSKRIQDMKSKVQDNRRSNSDGRESSDISSLKKFHSPIVLYPGSDGFQQELREDLGTNSKISIQLRMPDVFSSFIRKELNKDDSLWDLVVLTGDPDKGLWSGTCGSYISETWPGAADRIKKIIQHLQLNTGSYSTLDLISSIYGNVFVTIERDIPITVDTELTDTMLALGFRGKLESMLEILEAVTWLFSILQSWDPKEPAACSVAWRRKKAVPGQQFDFRYGLHISDLCTLRVPEQASCWKPLFPSTPCPTGFIVRPRPAGMQGVEMDFELLCLLCGLDYKTEDDKGLLLFGPKSMVYPVRVEGNCVQWHFQQCQPTNEEQHYIKGQRYCTLDLESLCGPFTRHFLGLWSKSIVTLGTDSQNYNPNKWSDAKEMVQESVQDGFNVGASIAIKQILGISWNQNYKIANTRKPFTLDPIVNRLYTGRNDPVIFYSPSEERAWMVPFMSAFWHILRLRAESMKFLGYSIPPCEKSGDGAQAAFDCFESCRSDTAKKATLNQRLTQTDEQETIEVFAEQLWRRLDLATRESCLRKKFFRKSVVGFELAGIATASSITLKKHDLDLDFTTRHSWTPFLDRAHLTIFYDGLVDPIQPSSEMDFAGVCGRSTWRTIPKRYNLLTVSLPCLFHSTRDLNGTRGRLECVAPGKYWSTTKPAGTLFNMCSSERNHRPCDRLLQLDNIYERTDPLVFESQAKRDGAIVFCFKHKFQEITHTNTIPPPLTTTNNNTCLGVPIPRTPRSGSGRNSYHGSNQSSPDQWSEGRTDSGYSSQSRLAALNRLSNDSISSVAVLSDEDVDVENVDKIRAGTGSTGTKKGNVNKNSRGKGRWVYSVEKDRNGRLYKQRRRSSS